jgi:hypothetical protein
MAAFEEFSRDPHAAAFGRQEPVGPPHASNESCRFKGTVNPVICHRDLCSLENLILASPQVAVIYEGGTRGNVHVRAPRVVMHQQHLSIFGYETAIVSAASVQSVSQGAGKARERDAVDFFRQLLKLECAFQI